jgi:dihydrofolate reductase
MSETTCHLSISLDGFVAGPDQSLEHPLGRRGIELHHWHLDEPLHDADARVRDLLLRPRGAYVMGRNLFGPIRGAAGDRGVDIAGGASTVRQALAAGVIDKLVLDFVPVLLGSGERLFDGVADPRLEPVEVIHSPLATHVRYRVGP